MYSDHSVFEHDRIVTTRVRLSSHDLAIERGRWSRTNRESRLCTCGGIQTEEHAVCFCPKSEEVRNSIPDVNYTNLAAVFNYQDVTTLTKLIRKCYDLCLN